MSKIAGMVRGMENAKKPAPQLSSPPHPYRKELETFDLEKDPDPYEYHDLPLWHRLDAMHVKTPFTLTPVTTKD